MRLDDLARALGGRAVGEPAVEITRVAPPDEAGPGAVVVVSDARLLSGIEAAAAVILPETSPRHACPPSASATPGSRSRWHCGRLRPPRFRTRGCTRRP